MISGSFGDNGELFFEIRLVGKSDLELPIEAILDTGFTNGWLAIDTQDLDTLGWPLMAAQVEMTTANGNARFDLYEGIIIIDDTRITIPVHVGDDIPDILLGSLCLDIMELIVNKPKDILTLEMCEISDDINSINVL
jgi:predicted aspartyl protease